ncbi:undecaprenyl-phosphate glucose phosphotransferase [Nitratireductor kimnyeongensis]|uniref:Undecaprenyl-phosphate glucose phosphotransferase n=1 Tax=Nitratireductor kimnyeongensis TaxID=430679 RepID=A0ABW0T318_9HYPH|nr:undecaprenyl-phosphate glucose phosphotransferase [Nitratireductor kimnyeongensis]
MNQIDPKRLQISKAPKQSGMLKAGDEQSKLNPIAWQVAQQYKRETMSPVMVLGVMRLVELTMLLATGFVLYAIYVGFSPLLFWHYMTVIGAGSLLMVVLCEFTGGYQMRALRNPTGAMGRVFIAWMATFAALALTGFFLKISDSFSRFWLGSWFICGFTALLVLRITMSQLLRRWARNGTIERRAVIVGGGANAEQLIRSIEQQPYNDIRICGLFDDRDDLRSPPVVAGYPKLGTITELVEFTRIARIDMLIVALPISAEKRVLSLLSKLWVLPVDIRLSAHANHLRFRPRAYSYIGSVPMLDIFDRPINDWDSVAKRGFDIVFSLLGILVFSPIMIATAMAIKLDSKGPVLFRQKRHGFNNESIEVLKFRSMYVDQCDPTAKNAVTKNDPRVTRVGRFIRKTSIDELPQFFNALFGSLSLVGPRPHALAAQAHDRLYEEVVDGYFARHKVKPGVTGWAQINGWRGEVDSDEKIRKRTEYDLYYIENWSLWLDLKILFLTPISLFNTENAY